MTPNKYLIFHMLIADLKKLAKYMKYPKKVFFMRTFCDLSLKFYTECKQYQKFSKELSALSESFFKSLPEINLNRISIFSSEKYFVPFVIEEIEI